MKTSVWSRQHVNANYMSRRPLVDDKHIFLKTIMKVCWRAWSVEPEGLTFDRGSCKDKDSLSGPGSWLLDRFPPILPLANKQTIQWNIPEEKKLGKKMLGSLATTWGAWRITTEWLASKRYAVTKQIKKPRKREKAGVWLNSRCLTKKSNVMLTPAGHIATLLIIWKTRRNNSQRVNELYSHFSPQDDVRVIYIKKVATCPNNKNWFINGSRVGFESFDTNYEWRCNLSLRENTVRNKGHSKTLHLTLYVRF